MNVTFSLTGLSDLYSNVGITAKEWMVMYGAVPYTGSNNGDFSQTGGWVPVTQSITAIMSGHETVLVIFYRAADGSNGHTVDTISGLQADKIYTINIWTGALSLTTSTTYKWTYNAGPGGKLSWGAGAGPQIVQTVVAGGTGAPVTAVPDTGYTFKQWSDGNDKPTRVDSNYNNVTFTAIFTANAGGIPPSGGGITAISGPFNLVPWLIGGFVLVGAVVAAKRGK